MMVKCPTCKKLHEYAADLLPGLALEGGYIKTDRNMATNLPGIPEILH